MTARGSPRRLSPLLLTSRRPSRVRGTLACVGSVALATALVYPLKRVSPVDALGVLYVLAVAVVSTYWGLTFGVATSLLSAAAFNFFHLPPGGHFTLADERDWVALLVFVLVAVGTGSLAEQARVRGRDAERRREEADLAAELAHLLLGTTAPHDAIELAERRLQDAIGVPAVRLTLAAQDGEEAEIAMALMRADTRVGTLLVPATISAEEQQRVRDRVVPSLESLLGAALHRAELQAEVVEAAALRRSDELKTAVLRSVSHDLRTPLTAILMAAAALDPDLPTRENVAEVRDQVLDASDRLRRLIDKLLDLSMLEGGRAEPRSAWYSLEEVLQEAIEQTEAPSQAITLSVDANVPLLEGDPGQLERAFANLLENGVRYSAGRPVSVRARAVSGRVRVLVVDRGPGIAAGEHERVFLPFYRADTHAGQRPLHSGSGLGLAIAKGFIELNGGRIGIESSPGQGAVFVIEFPMADRELVPAGERTEESAP
jgi:two-component system sensor histidine kinase KdpD